MKVNNNLSPSPVSELFDRTLISYGVVAKDLSEITGISENHISKFRRGKGDVTTEILFRLLEGMDELKPGSRSHFCLMLAGRRSVSSVGEQLEHLIESADDEDVEIALLAIAQRWRLSKYSKYAVGGDVLLGA
jgi:DNA-binding Xre family transcriptional regulator